jgi:hypothetical protein
MIHGTRPSASFPFSLILGLAGGLTGGRDDWPVQGLSRVGDRLELADSVLPKSLASIVGKKISGKTYYYLVESARVDGKPRIVSQQYLGPADVVTARLAGPRPASRTAAATWHSGTWPRCGGCWTGSATRRSSMR